MTTVGRELGRLSAATAPTEYRCYFAEAPRETVRRLAETPGPLTMIVGAGVSIEADLPSWDSLVERLIRDIADGRLPAAEREQWISEVMAPGLTAAGAVAQSLTKPNKFRSRLVNALYGDRRAASYKPAALAQQIAVAKWKLGSDLTLATLNYDCLIESALRERGQGEVLSYVAEGNEPARTAAVYHLHGRLGDGAQTGRVILSDADYAYVQAQNEWPERFMASALVNSTCVFIGLSLRDPNIIRWLHRYPGPHPHTALFVRQGSPHLTLAVRRELELVTKRRWAAHGVEVVWTNFFGELAQLVHELAIRRAGTTHPDFRTRARARLGAAKQTLRPRGARAFRAAQLGLSDLLDEMITTVREAAESDGVDLGAERLGLSLWAVDHEQGTLWHWGSADRYLKRRQEMRSVELAYDSQWVAVQAVSRGAPVTLDPDLYSSRWGLIRGIPVIYDRGRDGQSIVGCLTLTSTTPAAESALTRASAGVLGRIADTIADESADLFRPSK
jgi:hypothetical protein